MRTSLVLVCQTYNVSKGTVFDSMATERFIFWYFHHTKLLNSFRKLGEQHTRCMDHLGYFGALYVFFEQSIIHLHALLFYGKNIYFSKFHLSKQISQSQHVSE